MIKQTVTYEGEDGNPVTEELYFNITKIEAMKLQMQFPDGLDGHMARLTKTENAMEAFSLFEDIVLNAYGRKLPNGQFLKVDDDGRPLKYTFQHSPACSEFIIGLVENAERGAEFMRGMLPADLVRAAKEAEEAENAGKAPELEASEPVLDTANAVEIPVAPTEPTDEELLTMRPQDMTSAQMQRAYALKTGATSKQ